MAIVYIYFFPSSFKGGAIIVETDKENFRPPAKAITYMNRWNLTARHLRVAIGASMFFVKNA
jgi:hypothetical protein